MRIGSRLANYEILHGLDGGERGEVYRARDLLHDRLVALEILSLPPDLTAEARQQILGEARAALALDHPNICRLYEIGETAEGGVFLARALCAGEALKTRIERRPLALSEAVDLAAQIAAGLAAAHERGIVHGDVEPGNVWISPVERVQVMGFGLASLAARTVAYRSPEQLRGDRVDGRTDVWALGVVFYEMLSGKALFAGTAEEATRAILRSAPVSLVQREPGWPQAVTRILGRALARDPAARYAQIAEMRADLQAAVTGIEEDGEPTQHEGGASGPPTAAPAVLTGRQVSHFRVAELLGGGGMGVVYRAEDVRLGRRVALKFLAPEFGRDPIAKARFLTEARAASALEHPNLCTVLEVGETEEGLLFLAMPLYSGEGLDSRLARGPLPIEEALDMATQLARGLAKAHQNGIVHRDVKPANLFVTDDGVVKILDFGIAKLLGRSGPTQSGSFLGTPFYMAPEQTRGQEIDARADVWSLGAVLYQMLAGRPPFLGGTGTAVVYAVLHEEPSPLMLLRPEVPSEIARVVARMLEKDAEHRYADAGEVLAELRRAQGLTSATLSREPEAKRPRRRVGLVAILGLSLVAMAGVVGLLAWRRSGEAPGPQPTNVIRLTDDPGKETFPSLSPDGKDFVYARSEAGNSDIFLRRVSGSNPRNLTGDSPADDTQPAYSPDGQQIAFRSERDGGGIFLMGATGESVHRLTDFGFNPAWSPDGRQIAVATESAMDPASRESNSQISLVDVATQARRPLPIDDGVQPSWSPHGWRIAYWGLKGPEAHRAIFTIAADGSKPPITLVDDTFYNWSPVWSPDGRFLYFASNRGGSMNLWRVAIDERSGQKLRDPEAIRTAAEWSALPSFSHDGRDLLYATSFSRSYLERITFDPERGRMTGPPTPVYEGAPQVGACDVSPDGRWFVYRTASPQEDLFLIRPDGSERRELTDDPARDRSPRWSPAGRSILFYSNRSGKYEAWTIRPDGSGLTQVTHLQHDVSNPVWSPDGKQIAFTYDPRGVAILDLTRPRSTLRFLPVVEGGRVLARVSWSGDGNFLAGQLLLQDGSPVPGIVVWSLKDNLYRRLTTAGEDPVFFPDGKRILFIERQAIRLVEVASGEVQTLLTPKPRFSYKAASVGLDGRTLCAVGTSDQGDIWKLSLVDAARR